MPLSVKRESSLGLAREAKYPTSCPSPVGVEGWRYYQPRIELRLGYNHVHTVLIRNKQRTGLGCGNKDEGHNHALTTLE